MTALTEFLDEVPAGQHDLMRALHVVISEAAPDLAASLKWGNLTYSGKTNVCSLVSHKDHVNLQFWRGADMKDPRGVLTGTGKEMRHVKIGGETDLDPGLIADLVKQASGLDEV